MKLRRLARYLARKAREVEKRRRPDFVVGRGHMIRWYLVPRNPLANVYLHKHCGDDPADMHDHMYASISLVLSGSIAEYYVEEARKVHNMGRKLSSNGSYDLVRAARRRRLEEGQVVVRSSRMAHRLALRSSEAWTIFVTGPRVKSWGFWCPRGFQPFERYVERRGLSSGCED